MAILFHNLSKSFQGNLIFSNINGRINNADKIGLIGENGVGKTTLLKIFCGLEEKDAGTLLYEIEAGGIAYLSQQEEYDSNTTLVQEVNNAFYQLSQDNSASLDFTLQARKMLFQLGFMETDLNKKATILSGGEKTKLALAKILVKNPMMLLLDEPTNHLDMKSIIWLEKFLQHLNCTVVIVSHDRLFLDHVVSKIFVMQSSSLKEYSGNYTCYKAQREIEIKSQQREHEKQTREIKHLKKIILEREKWFHQSTDKCPSGVDYRNWKDKSKVQARIIKSKEIQLQKLEENRISKPKEEKTTIFDILKKYTNEQKKIPENLIEVNELKMSFEKRLLFEGVIFTVKKADKIAVLGENGTGKTTLFKLLLGKKASQQGSISISPAVQIGYFSQELEDLHEERSIVDEILACGIEQKDARNILASFLFQGNDVFKRISMLSMGEKCRVAFCKMICTGADLLLLDEPTNYLDILSRENIEDVLQEFPGTVLLISHDRYFVQRFANRIFEIENKRISVYEGGYAYYQNKEIQVKKEREVGKDYRKLTDEIRILECKIALLSGRLGNKHLTEEEKEELSKQFFDTAKHLQYYKSLMR